MSNIFQDFKNRKGKWVKTFNYDGRTCFTKSGRLWSDVRQRCKVGGHYQNKKPTYIGCTMSDNFKDFQFFADWHQNQIGYGLTDYHLDKDILSDYNKLYSEDNCVLVPKDLNAFFKRFDSLQKLPQGVWISQSGLYGASIGNGVTSRKKHLGIFKTIKDASHAYKVAKDSLGKVWYKRLSNNEFNIDPRVIERMRNWEYISDWKKYEADSV